MAMLARGARAFGHFWVDFLLGDSPILAPATLIIVGVAYGLRHERIAAIIVVPLLVVTLIGATAFFGRRRSETQRAPVEEEPG